MCITINYRPLPSIPAVFPTQTHLTTVNNVINARWLTSLLIKYLLFAEIVPAKAPVWMMYLKNQYLSTTTRYKALPGRHPPALLHSSHYHPDTTSTRQAAKSAVLWIFISSLCDGLTLNYLLNTGVRVGLIPNLIFRVAGNG